MASASRKASVGEAAASSAAERAARAGWGLSAASIHWGGRGGAAKPVAVTERDCRLLGLLHDVNYLSSSQMALLGWGARLHLHAAEAAPPARPGTDRQVPPRGASRQLRVELPPHGGGVADAFSPRVLR